MNYIKWMDKSVVTKILDEMQKQGLTKSELARKIDWSPQLLGKKLRNQERIMLSDLWTIAKGLGVRPGDLLPSSIRYDIAKVPLSDIIKNIVEELLRKNLSDYYKLEK